MDDKRCALKLCIKEMGILSGLIDIESLSVGRCPTLKLEPLQGILTEQFVSANYTTIKIKFFSCTMPFFIRLLVKTPTKVR